MMTSKQLCLAMALVSLLSYCPRFATKAAGDEPHATSLRGQMQLNAEAVTLLKTTRPRELLIKLSVREGKATLRVVRLENPDEPDRLTTVSFESDENGFVPYISGKYVKSVEVRADAKATVDFTLEAK